MPKFFVTPAPGWYGDRTRVLSSHATLAAACRKARGKGWAVREGAMRRGDEFLRVYEQHHPPLKSCKR